MNDSSNNPRNDLILYRGASHHLVNDERVLLKANECNDDDVLIADDNKLVLAKIGVFDSL